MFKNYLLVTIRSIWRNKLFSVINLAGLILGISSFLIILQYANFELSYDNFHVDKENIYRIQADNYQGGELSRQWAPGPTGIGPAVMENFPEVVDYVRLRGSNTALSYNNIIYKEDRVFYASQSFFGLISYPLLKGVDSLVLKEPFTMAISQSIAKKYFGDEEPMGKIMTLNGYADFTVTGVFRDPPENTHMKIDILYSFGTYEQYYDESELNAWDWYGFYTYIKLREGTTPEQFEKKLANFVEQEKGEELHAEDRWIVFRLERIDDIHLGSNLMEEFEVNGDGTVVYGLMAVAFFIILIAWLNYINLSTAKSMQRAKEIGMRKVMGSSRRQLISQFLMESMLLNLVASLIAVVILLAFVPYFDYFTGKPITSNLFANTKLLIGFPMLICLGAFLSGMYPALVTSGYKPISTLKGNLTNASKGQLLRKSIVVFQFSLSIVLIVCTVTIYKQIKFMQQKELGISIDRTLILRGPNSRDSTYSTKYRAFKTELLRHAAIQSVATSSDVPGNSNATNNASGVRKVGAPETEGQSYRLIDIDYDYISAYGLELIAGRNFSRERSGDISPALMNETGVHQLGFHDMKEAVGQKIFLWNSNYEIIGVLKDYHQNSPKTAFQPIIYRPLWYEPSWNTLYSIKLNGENAKDAVTAIKSTFDNVFEGNAFSYFFLDDQYNQQYRSEELFYKLFNFFSSLAIFIACMGLFGISIFSIALKMKEIGVRKVFGASIGQIMVLLSSDFFKLIAIAVMVGLPVSWYIMKKWLEGFAFKEEVNLWTFIIAIGALLLVTISTVSTQVFRASIANPIETLRDE